MSEEVKTEGEIETDELDIFRVFGAEIRAAMQKNTLENKELDQEKVASLRRVLGVFNAIFSTDENKAKVHLYPAFSAGCVTIEAKDVDISGENLELLREALSVCDVFAVERQPNGNVDVGVTIEHIYIKDDSDSD